MKKFTHENWTFIGFAQNLDNRGFDIMCMDSRPVLSSELELRERIPADIWEFRESSSVQMQREGVSFRVAHDVVLLELDTGRPDVIGRISPLLILARYRQSKIPDFRDFLIMLAGAADRPVSDRQLAVINDFILSLQKKKPSKVSWIICVIFVLGGMVVFFGQLIMRMKE